MCGNRIINKRKKKKRQWFQLDLIGFIAMSIIFQLSCKSIAIRKSVQLKKHLFWEGWYGCCLWTGICRKWRNNSARKCSCQKDNQKYKKLCLSMQIMKISGRTVTWAFSTKKKNASSRSTHFKERAVTSADLKAVDKKHSVFSWQ